MAGATSRTVVSPLERLKIIMQVQSSSTGQPYKGVLPSLIKMWKEEGPKGYMKGNGVNCLRIFPYSAVQFTTYETLKSVFTDYEDGQAGGKGKGKLGTGLKLVAGSLAGITSVASTYPLDLVRSRLSISAAHLGGLNQPRGKELGIVGMTLKVYRTEGGIRGLYMGMVPTAAGVAPYVALNFVFYEKLRVHFLADSIEDDYSETRIALTKLACGAAAGGTSQTITYPFDVIRRKMQVVGLQRSLSALPLPHSPTNPIPSAIPITPPPPSPTPHGSLIPSRAFSSLSTTPTPPPPSKPHAYSYTSGSGAFIQIFQREGLKGLYRGILPNLLKVAPSMGVSFYTYDTVLRLMHGEIG
ncbi:mitochondrial carrier domain-containing protein [Mrakia frigida]|uniref:mitochondrial carrier domain-containing protein n=1 Tax=Mrakia frigida TaxID=29902 RepID=UPI003FCBFDC6